MPLTIDDIKTKKGVIYKITNLVDGKSYIGQTRRTLYKRHNGIELNRIDNSYLKKAIEKHGLENFSREILEFDLSDTELDLKELYYIKELNTLYPNGYNFVSGGNSNKRISEEGRKFLTKKICEAKQKNYTLYKDEKEYNFKNVSTFAKEHGLSQSSLYSVLSGITRSHKKFHLKDVDIRFKRSLDQIRILEKDGQTYEVYNVMRFAQHHKLRTDCLYHVFSGRVREHCGFHLPGLKPKEERKPMDAQKFASIKLIDGNGNIVNVPNENRRQFMKDTKIDIYALLSKKRNISKGYKVYKLNYK